MLVFGIEENWSTQKNQQQTKTTGGIASRILAWATLTMFCNKRMSEIT